MEKKAYILSLIYFPLVILYFVFGNSNSDYWGIYYFTLEKMTISMLFFAIAEKQINLSRKYLFSTIGFLNFGFIVYILLDVHKSMIASIAAAIIFSAIYIAALIYNFFCHDRKTSR